MINVNCKHGIRRAGIDLKKGTNTFADDALTEAQLAQIAHADGVTVSHMADKTTAKQEE